MSSYAELMNQAQALMQQAEQLRKAQIADVIREIKAKMLEFGITVEELGGAGATRAKRGGAVKVKAEAKFKGPNGELWSGGLGRKPEWVRTILASGGDIEQYRIAP
jgi:DNA-binding protein H-NS